MESKSPKAPASLSGRRGLICEIDRFASRIYTKNKGVKMKNIRSLLLFLIVLTAFFAFLEADGQELLADLYRMGKIRLVPEIALDDDSMPEDVFFHNPMAISCDKEGNVYILDYKANDIKKFDSYGKFIKIIGRRGQGPGEFNMPFLMTFARDRLVIWDMMNLRFCGLTPNGDYIESVNFPFEAGWPRKLKSLPNGSILIELEKRDRSDLNAPQECILDLYSSDFKYKKTIYSHHVLRNKYVRKPRSVNIPQPYTPLVYWDVSPDGKVIIGFSEKYEIEIHGSDKGKISSFTHPYESVKVTEEDKKAHFAGMTFSVDGVRQKTPDFIIEKTEFPKFKPAFWNIMVDSEGNILVFTHRKNREEMFRYFDAFSSEGNFIAHVQVVGDVPFPATRSATFIGRTIWTLGQGEDELIKAIKYKISN